MLRGHLIEKHRAATGKGVAKAVDLLIPLRRIDVDDGNRSRVASLDRRSRLSRPQKGAGSRRRHYDGGLILQVHNRMSLPLVWLPDW